MKPNWLKLLELQQTRNYGLTLPFLIGALRNPPGVTSSDESICFEEFDGLLASMRDKTPPGYSVSIGKCSRLGQPVATIVDVPQGHYKEWPSRELPKLSLYIAREYLTKGASSSETSMRLWMLCKDAVMTGRFSFDLASASYRSFTPLDFDFIEKAIQGA